MSDTDEAAKRICAERCAFMGEPPCWRDVNGGDAVWPNPACNDPGCVALAEAAAKEPGDG